MKYPFNDNYQPPFPSFRVTLVNDGEGLRLSEVPALLDTGSDGTLVPIIYLQQIYAPALTDTRLRSHWGEWRVAQLFSVDLEINGFKLPGVFVVGDEVGEDIVLGRNVLNKLRLLLDGPANVTELLTSRARRT
jgi:predicted aspartyl protease